MYVTYLYIHTHNHSVHRASCLSLITFYSLLLYFLYILCFKWQHEVYLNCFSVAGQLCCF